MNAEKKEPKSELFQIGYKKCLATFDSGINPSAVVNPYKDGTEQHKGFEAAFYDLTQK